MKNYVRLLAGPLLVLAVLSGALWLLHHELRDYELRDFLNSLATIPSAVLWTAIGLTCLNYLILMGYDLLGVTYLGQKIPWPRVAFGSFLGCAVGNNLGTLLGGSTVRYRLYSAWGLSAADIVRLVLILTVTFWIGLFGVAGVMFIWQPVTIPGALHLPISTTRPLGMVLVTLAGGYLLLCILGPRGIKFRGWEFSPPPIWLSLLQYLVATLDLMVAAGVLYVLLPPTVDVAYASFLTIYLLGLIATLITQVPGGIGLLELLIVVLLNPAERQDVMGALLAFRTIYFFLPLAFGLMMLGLHEVAVHQDRAREAFSVLGRWAPVVAPKLLTVFVFLAGVALLFSGAIPVPLARLARWQQLMPLAVIETSHVLSSVVGALLLILARGLQRRTEAAYFWVCGLLALGVLSIVFKGAHFALPIGLAIVLMVFIPSRSYFFRRGVRLTEWLSASWIVAIVGALVCAVWLFIFAFKNTPYDPDIWWQYALTDTAARSLRATSAAIAVTLALLAVRLLRVHEPLPGVASRAELQDATQIVNGSPRTTAHLALTGDKRLLFNQPRNGFVMFGIAGNSCIALGDPVGPESALRELAWEFWELCDVSGRRTVFFQVDESYLPVYEELGLVTEKIGDEARVSLADFELASAADKPYAKAHGLLTHRGFRFEIVAPHDVDRLIPELREISNEWLNDGRRPERKFSVGHFNEDYIRQHDVALLREGERIQAFAVLWGADRRNELAVDLLRYLPEAPEEIVDFLFVELLQWGKSQGYRWLNLGTAPLTATDGREHAPLWNQLADVGFRQGRSFENVVKLRQFKQQFDPQWRSKYLACPAGLTLAAVLADVGKLMSGQKDRAARKLARAAATSRVDTGNPSPPVV
jgi:phosphatidylglycerol lysyltransferase